MLEQRCLSEDVYQLCFHKRYTYQENPVILHLHGLLKVEGREDGHIEKMMGSPSFE